MAETFAISGLGHAGDGFAETPQGRVFVPFTLPGETVTAERHGERADLVNVVSASPDRVEPPCPHFGVCGGCALQHMAPAAYLAWKRDQIVAAFTQRGIDAPVAPIIASRPAGRRRAVFTAERTGRKVTLGFNRAGSHEVIAVPDCKVLVPAILRHLDTIGDLVAPLVQAGRRARVTVVAADNGLDIAIEDLGRPDAKAVGAVSTRIKDPTTARVTVGGEEAFRAREPVLAAGPAALLPVPGGFIQAVAEAEEALAAIVLKGVGPSKMVADLFAGIGTFTFRLARIAKVTAVDGDAALVAALQRASRHAPGLKAVTALRRDLSREPLVPNELAGFDAVVFDPPRAGAKAQAEALAASTVRRVVAVSCNPATLARDARILMDGGYRLTGVQPVDQFVWSAEIEAVATFER